MPTFACSQNIKGDPQFIQVRPCSVTDVYPHMSTLRPHAAQTW